MKLSIQLSIKNGKAFVGFTNGNGSSKINGATNQVVIELGKIGITGNKIDKTTPGLIGVAISDLKPSFKNVDALEKFLKKAKIEFDYLEPEDECGYGEKKKGTTRTSLQNEFSNCKIGSNLSGLRSFGTFGDDKKNMDDGAIVEIKKTRFLKKA